MITKSSAALLCLLLVSSLPAKDRPTATVDGKVYPVYDVATEAKPLERITPVMPYSSSRAPRSGSALIGAVVNEKGAVRKTYLVKVDADGDLRAAMINAVEATKFPVIRDPDTQAAISYVVIIPMGLASAPSREPRVSPKLAEIISDPKYFRSALGIKALVSSDPATGEIPSKLLADLKSAGLTDGVQLIPLPRDAVLPYAKKRTAPAYPESLRRKKVDGRVEFLCVIGADGTVKGMYCVAAAQPEFAIAAAAALAQWRFEPARIQNTAVPVIVNTMLEFGPN
jgi:hypothetical protein